MEKNKEKDEETISETDIEESKPEEEEGKDE